MKHLLLNRFLTLTVTLMFANIACSQTTKNLQENNQAIDDIYDEDDMLTLGRYLKTSYCPHELSIWMAGGISMLDYKQSIGKTTDGLGGSLGFGYTRFLNQSFGLSFGAEYAFYQRNLKAERIQSAYDTYDVEGNPIVYHSLVENYKEKQQLGMINFPLTVLYQAGDKHKCYVSLGLKFGLPVCGKYKGNNTTLTTSGYYPDYDQTEIWQNDFGYGIFPVENKKTLDFGISLMGTLETGAKWNIGIGKDHSCSEDCN